MLKQLIKCTARIIHMLWVCGIDSAEGQMFGTSVARKVRLWNLCHQFKPYIVYFYHTVLISTSTTYNEVLSPDFHQLYFYIDGCKSLNSSQKIFTPSTPFTKPRQYFSPMQSSGPLSKCQRHEMQLLCGQNEFFNNRQNSHYPKLWSFFIRDRILKNEWDWFDHARFLFFHITKFNERLSFEYVVAVVDELHYMHHPEVENVCRPLNRLAQAPDIFAIEANSWLYIKILINANMHWFIIISVNVGKQPL